MRAFLVKLVGKQITNYHKYIKIDGKLFGEHFGKPQARTVCNNYNILYLIIIIISNISYIIIIIIIYFKSDTTTVVSDPTSFFVSIQMFIDAHCYVSHYFYLYVYIEYSLF